MLVHVLICVNYLYRCVCIWRHVYRSMCMFVSLGICCACMCPCHVYCPCVCLCIRCIYVWFYMYIHIYPCSCVCICVCIYVYFTSVTMFALFIYISLVYVYYAHVYMCVVVHTWGCDKCICVHALYECSVSVCECCVSIRTHMCLIQDMVAEDSAHSTSF